MVPAFLLLIPISALAGTGSLSYVQTSIDPQIALTQVNLLVSQYDARIRQLEAENTVLRYEMTKAGIKIPLIDYS
jgi:hypothetical protein